jgi:hypothetical protein
MTAPRKMSTRGLRAPQPGRVAALALISVAIGVVGGQMIAEAASSEPVCQSVEWVEESAASPTWLAAWHSLQERGWKGSPYDGSERLYAPACATDAGQIEVAR